VNRNADLAVCRLCGRRYVVDADDVPVLFDRDTGDPAPICGRCVDDVNDQIRRAVGSCQ
jgi:hypothetical protein